MNCDKIYNFIISQLPKDSKIILKELLEFNNFLYSKISSFAIQYDNGIHPKHRLTKYHDFFINNVERYESVIDLGSGRGYVAYDVSNKTVAQVLGIELNHDNFKYASNTYRKSNLKFVQGDVYKDIPCQHFDVVILSNVLEHLSKRIELLRLIVLRVAPKKILIRVPHFEREWMVALKKEMGVNYLLDSTHKIEYTLEEFEKEIQSSNLKILSKKINWGEIWAICV